MQLARDEHAWRTILNERCSANGMPKRREQTFARALLVVATLAVLPTGMRAGFSFWFVVEAAGVLFALRSLFAGRGQELVDALFMAPALTAWLLGSGLLAALQLILEQSSSPFSTLGSLHYWIGSLLLIPIVYRGNSHSVSFQLPPWLCGLITALLGMSLISGTYALYHPLTPDATPPWWPFVYRNHYCALVVLVTPMLLFTAIHDKRSRWLAAVAATMGIAGVASCGSRSGLVAIAGTLLGFGAAYFPELRRRGLVPVALAFACCAAAVLTLTNWAALGYRLGQETSLLNGRLAFWKSSWQMILARPFLGWGFGVWPDLYPRFMEHDIGLIVNHAHSDWLELAAEGGLIILPLLTALFLRSVLLSRGQPWAIGVPVFLAMAMVDYPIQLPLLLVVLVTVHCLSEIHRQAFDPHPLVVLPRLSWLKDRLVRGWILRVQASK